MRIMEIVSEIRGFVAGGENKDQELAEVLQWAGK
jgi:hypothetical protein